MEQTQHSLESLSPMFKCCMALASFPPYSFNGKFKATGRRYKIYTITFLVFTVCIFCIQIYGRLTCSLDNVKALVVKLPDDFSNVFLFVLALRTGVLNYTKCDDLKQLLYKLECFDKAILKSSTRNKLFFTVFVTMHLISIATILSHAAVFGVYSGMEFYKCNFGEYFLYYLSYTNLIMVVWVGVEIKFRYDTLNNYLLQYNYHLHEDNTSADVLRQVSVHLKCVRMWHNDLCNLVEKYNSLFGSSMLLFILLDISNILSNIVAILDMVAFRNHSSESYLLGYMIFVKVMCLVFTVVSIFRLSLNVVISNYLPGFYNRYI